MANLKVLDADGLEQTVPTITELIAELQTLFTALQTGLETIQIASIAAGDANIGNVDVVSLPAIPAGTNNIGDVDVLTLPELPAGTNNIGDVDIASIAAGDNNIGNVDVVSSALPTGAATAAAQATGNTSLSSIDGKVPALGQALAAASVPVVLPAAQITTLTPPAAITGFATATNQDTANTALANIETATEALAHAEDAAHSSGDTGVLLLAVRNDTGTALAGTEGDYIPLGTDLNGNLRIVGTVAATLDAATLAALETVSVATIGSGSNVIGGVNQGAAGVEGWLVELNTGLNYLDDNILTVPAIVNAAAATMTRPADTTAYASGDLVANSTTAGSVVALSFDIARDDALPVSIRRMRIRKSGTSVTTCTLRLHLYGTAPTVTNGDNGAWLSTQSATYYGALEAIVDKAFSDGAVGTGLPLTGAGSEILISLASGTTIYGLLEARSAYTPASAETFTVTLEAVQG